MGERNTPTVLNAAFLSLRFWDGRTATLEEQALGPIEADIEMGMSIDAAVTRLEEFDVCEQMLEKAFGSKDAITNHNVALTCPYMNNGIVATLQEAIIVMGQELLKGCLPQPEVEEITAFLHALTGHIPAFVVPAPP